MSEFGWVFELRWILAGIGAVLLVGIFWWGGRRGGHARGLGAGTTGARAAPSVAPGAAPAAEAPTPFEDVDDFGVPPFEPLSIHSGEYDQVPVLDLPMRADAAPEPCTAPELAAAAPSLSRTAAPSLERTAAPSLERTAAPSREARADPSLERRTAPRPNAPPASEQQKILSFRVSARGASRWSGRELLAALDAQGLAFGRYGVFHRNDAEGRSLFCVASLIEPGSFDVARMPDQEFRGISAFAVLPGNAAPLATFDALLATVCGLAEKLTGIVQDAGGAPLSAQRARELREDVVQFQARLS